MHASARTHRCHLRPRAQGLTLHTLYYADEVRQVAEYGHTDNVELKDAEKKLALQLIESLARAHFEPEKFHDTYRQTPAGDDRSQAEGARKWPRRRTRRSLQ